MMNPPGHTRLRKLVSRAFTPRAVSAMRSVSERVAAELCDSIDGAVDPRSLHFFDPETGLGIYEKTNKEG